MLDPQPTYSVRVHRLDPTLAELHIEFANLPPDVLVHGRVMGPRCPGVSTIEIAYHLQRLTHPVYRVLIPEPVFWSEARPCVYEGPVEFQRGKEMLGKISVSVGIRQT